MRALTRPVYDLLCHAAGANLDGPPLEGRWAESAFYEARRRGLVAVLWAEDVDRGRFTVIEPTRLGVIAMHVYKAALAAGAILG